MCIRDRTKRVDKVGYESKLEQAVAMWPTPRANEPGRTTKGYGRGLAELVEGKEQIPPKIKNWPTPTASDVEGGIVQNVELENGSFSRKNQKGERWGVKLRDAVNHTEKMWPTPSARDWKGGSGTVKEENGKYYRQSNTTGTKFGVRLDAMVEKMEKEKIAMFPTPTANEDACGKPTGKMQKMLGNHPQVRGSGSGTLNPTWVEWLMGYPKGWTDLKD